MKKRFLANGYLKLDQLISLEEVEQVLKLYNLLLENRDLTKNLRSDLAGENSQTTTVEKITQIMRPSMVLPELAKHPVYEKALVLAQDLLGDDMQLDFDMMINKAPYTNTETPWHQDAAYWIDLPDKRAVSCWVALDQVMQDNGCMWFIPKKEKNEILPHHNLPGGGALFCKPYNIDKAEAIELSPGGCTFHDGYTLHFSKGNSTPNQRRAIILNFRPKTMIAIERSNGIDHTGARFQRNKN